MPPPVPPSVNAGRMMSGKTADFFRHGAGFVQIVRGAGNRNVETDGEHEFLERLHGLRPCEWLPAFAPIISMPCFSSAPLRCRAIAVFKAVWPPRVGRRTSLYGCRRPAGADWHAQTFHLFNSRTMIFSTHSGVIGSM